MNGYLNILKPTGMTSSNVVSRVKYILKIKKAGHAGTLDPMAVGVLPVMLGKATKMFDYLNLDRKIYAAEFTFGVSTDTSDAEGSVTEESSVIPDKQSIEEKINREFLGSIMQRPPKVSAVSINGKRAYSLARAGAEFEIASRKVEIFSFDLIRRSGEKSFLFRIECSKGTYIRSLCTDLAKRLDTCAYVSFLSREKSGFFEINDSITLEQLEKAMQNNEVDKYLVVLDEPISSMPQAHVPIDKQNIINNGGNIKADMDDTENIRVYCGGDFIGIGQIENGYLKIKKKFYV